VLSAIQDKFNWKCQINKINNLNHFIFASLA